MNCPFCGGGSGNVAGSALGLSPYTEWHRCECKSTKEVDGKQEMEITVMRLESGYYHLRGRGHNDWAQPSVWPCSPEELCESADRQASPEFLAQCMEMCSAALHGEE